MYSALTPPHEVCAMLRNYRKYFVMIPILHIFSEMHPRAGFPGVPNSPTLKSHKHSAVRDFSGTVQGLGLVLVRNDQPFDLPCHMVSREGQVYMADMGYGQNVVFEPYIQGFITR